MTALSPRQLRTGQFTFTDERELVAEASDLGAFLGRLYDDAADVGFALVSDHTGAVVIYTLQHDERDGEGELLATVFAPISNPDAPLVRVFND